MTPKSKCTLFLCSQRTELLPLKQGILQIPVAENNGPCAMATLVAERAQVRGN